MKNLMMTPDLEKRLDFSDTTMSITTVEFGETSLTGDFYSLSKESTAIKLVFEVDAQDCPLKYFGLSASKAIINNGSEKLIIFGDLEITNIFKKKRFLITVEAKNYEKLVRT